MLANTIWDQILDVAKRFAAALEESQVPYRIIGGFACYLHVQEVNGMGAHLTPNIDIAVYRKDVKIVESAAARAGFVKDNERNSFHLAESPVPVKLFFLGEWAHPYNAESMPGSAPVRSAEGFFIAPVTDLVRMKLTALRLKDKLHIQDLDAAGLITAKVEASLSPLFREHLAEVRATE